MKQIVNVEGRKIGKGQPCFIVGEIGSNHCLDKQVVRDLIDAAAVAKFDAVKFQIYDPKEAFSANETTTDVGLEELYGVCPWWEVARDSILMPRDWFGEMFECCRYGLLQTPRTDCFESWKQKTRMQRRRWSKLQELQLFQTEKLS